MKNVSWLLFFCLILLSACTPGDYQSSAPNGAAAPPPAPAPAPAPGPVPTALQTITVTVSQSGQDPTSSQPTFNVSFSATINPVSFTASDIIKSGTASVTGWTISHVSSNRNFTIRPTMAANSTGTVIASIGARTVINTNGDTNFASTSSDNSILYLLPLTISRSSNHFQSTVQGFSSEVLQATITNSTGQSVSGCSLSLTGAHANQFQIMTNTCGTSLAASATCEVSVRALPTSSGLKQAMYSYQCTQAMSPSVDLQVTASNNLEWVGVGQLSHSFGLVKTGMKSIQKEFFFRNQTGTSYATCSAPAVSNAFTIDSTDCGASMSGFSMCKVIVAAAPLTVGYIQGTISRTCDGIATSSPIAVTGMNEVPVSLSSSFNATCLNTNSGKTYCWGGDNGDIPSELFGSNNAQISVSENGVCRISSTGTPSCLGWGHIGGAPTGLTGVLQFATGRGFFCALLTNKSVSCFGSNSSGQFGNGTNTQSSTPVAGPTGPYEQISAGEYHVCGRRLSGAVDCWGSGYGSTPVQVSGLGVVTELAGGKSFHCALINNASVSCWGNSSYGSLGNGSVGGSSFPVTVSGLNDAIFLSPGGAGAEHMCAVRTGGSIVCWGRNDSGQLGSGLTHSNVPVAVPALTNISQITRGEIHTCALQSDSSVVCWGNNSYRQLGRGNFRDGYPIEITGLPGTPSQVVVNRDITCALVTGNVYCWGISDLNIPLWIGNAGVSRAATPVQISGLSNITKLSVANRSICAQDTSNDTKCWGHNQDGELGLGSTIEAQTPTLVSGFSGGVELSGGGTFRCAYGGGNASCAGGTTFGSNGSQSATSTTAIVPVTAVTGYITQMAGSEHINFALLNDKSLWSWGGNSNSSGPLGAGGGVFRRLAGGQIMSNVDAVSASSMNAYALHNSGRVSTWGAGLFSGTGLNSFQEIPRPTQVHSLSGRNIVELATGRIHACALDNTGLVWCWGSQRDGQVGTGKISSFSELVPRVVLGFSAPVTKLWGSSTLADHSCAITSDNKLWCWGKAEIFDHGSIPRIESINGFRP